MLIRGTILCSIFLSILHLIFLSFYVERLPTWDPTDTTDLTPWYFVICQLLYVLWFGLKDVSLFYNWTAFVFRDEVRTRPLMYCGPLFALCFAFLWIPVTKSAIHSSFQFTVMMILYTELHSACVSVLPILGKAENIGPLFGGVCAGIACYLLEVGGSLRLFQLFTSTCAFGAAVVFFLVGESLEVSPRTETAIVDPVQFRRFVTQTMSRDGMKAAVFLWALQGFCGIVFTMMFYTSVYRCDAFISSEVRALLVGSVVVIPRLFGSSAESLFRTFGRRWLMSCLLAARVAMGMLMLTLVALGDDMRTHSVSTCFMVLLLLGRVLSDAVECLQAQVIRDIADEDAVVFGRAKSMDVAVRRLLTAVSRPFQALALVVVFRDIAAGGEVKESALLSGWTAVATSLPVLLVWKQLYNLYGEHLQFVHMAMRKRHDVDSQFV